MGVLDPRAASSRLPASITQHLEKAIGGLEGFLIREQTPDGPIRRP